MAIVRLTSFVCWGGKGNGINNEEIFIDYCKRMAILCTSWARSLLVLDQSNFRGFKIRKWLALNTGKRDWNREVVVGMRLVTANLLICQINQLSLKKVDVKTKYLWWTEGTALEAIIHLWYYIKFTSLVCVCLKFL